MARYSKEYPRNGFSDSHYREICDHLTQNGFEQTVYEGERVFQRGTGAMVAPSFLKLTYTPDKVRVEAWLKMAILPGVFVGEMGLTGFAGSAARGKLKKAVAYIDTLLTGNAPAATEGINGGGEDMTNSRQCCPFCGTVYPQGSNFCASCGNVLQPPAPTPAEQGLSLSKKEYLKRHAPAEFYKGLRITAIASYILTGINAAVVVKNPYGLIDVALTLGLTLGMHLGRSKGCAIGLLVYSIVNMILLTVLNGMVGGLWWLILGIAAVVVFNKADKAYAQDCTPIKP